MGLVSGSGCAGWVRVMDPKYKPLGLRAELGYLTEECGEVLAAVGKTLRWGTESMNPELKRGEKLYGETNSEWILRELNDLKRAIELVEASIASGEEYHP